MILLKTSSREGLDKDILDSAYRQISKSFDNQYGGFGKAPKFLMPHKLAFLLRYWKRTQDKRALEMVEKTLQAMRLGGIYDHIGFGFHCYSTDAKWLVPHFEKMLYDQALLAMAYTEAFQATRKEEYERTAREIFTYVLRDMRSPEGGFYSAEDADSEGEEGEFYLWTESEIRKILTTKEAELAIKVFNIEKEGNFFEETTGSRTGKNILYLKKTLPQIANELQMDKKEIEKLFETIRSKLFDAREKRVHPHKDDKILIDWNGLMIAALAKGAMAFDEPNYAEAAKGATNFILTKMLDEKGRLYHRHKDGDTGIPGFLNDYAFFIWGLIELYETTFDVQYFKIALNLNEVMLKNFWDESFGAFCTTPTYGEKVLVRKHEIYDGAIPSGNSVAMLDLLRLARMTGNPEFEQKVAQIERAFSGEVQRSPEAFTQFMIAVDFAEGPSYEIVIAGKPEAADTKNMIRALSKPFIPNKVVLFRSVGEENSEIIKLAEFTRYLSSIEGKATAYVCHNYKCGLPTTDIREMLKSLNAKDRR